MEESAVTSAVEPERLCRESVEVAEPAEQLPNDCECVRDIADMQVTVTAVAAV